MRNTGTAEDVAIPPTAAPKSEAPVATTETVASPQISDEDDGDETLDYFSKLAEEE